MDPYKAPVPLPYWASVPDPEIFPVTESVQAFAEFKTNEASLMKFPPLAATDDDDPFPI